MRDVERTSRRNFLKDMHPLGRIGLTLTSGSLAVLAFDALTSDRKVNQPNLPRDILNAFSSLASTPVAQVTRLRTPKIGQLSNAMSFSPNLGVSIAPHSIVRVPESLKQRPLPRAGTVTDGRKLPDRLVRASGFVVGVADAKIAVTNEHNLRNVNAELETHCLMCPESDIGVVSTRQCKVHAPFQINTGKLSTLANEQIAGREVCIYGLGARSYWEARGSAIYFPKSMANYGFDPCICGCFVVKCPVGVDIVDPRELIGMSGSPAVDVETGDVIGVYGKVQPKIDITFTDQTRESVQLLVFSGPDELNNLIGRYVTM